MLEVSYFNIQTTRNQRSPLDVFPDNYCFTIVAALFGVCFNCPSTTAQVTLPHIASVYISTQNGFVRSNVIILILTFQIAFIDKNDAAVAIINCTTVNNKNNQTDGHIVI